MFHLSSLGKIFDAKFIYRNKSCSQEGSKYQNYVYAQFFTLLLFCVTVNTEMAEVLILAILEFPY